METLVRPEVRVVKVIDGDTYYFTCNWKRAKTWPWRDSSTVKVRLRDYSAREAYDRALTDPKGLGRVDGPTAKAIAEEYLLTAKLIQVEFQGFDSLAREVCWVWTDGESFGQRLMAEHAVAPIAEMG